MKKIILLLAISIIGAVLFSQQPAMAARLPIQKNSTVQAAGGAQFFVSPTGSPSGDGSRANPWDLTTALAHPPTVHPGDTIWLRGGVYQGLVLSRLAGAEGAPIIVRSNPGEWAVIDTQHQATDPIEGFRIESNYTYYWDFEITNTRLTNRGGTNIELENDHNKLINLIVHDAENNAINGDNEIYGSLFYNNGLNDSGNDHQMYVQNDNQETPIRIVDCLIFNGYAFGINAYAGGVGRLDGIHMIGNVVFNAGAAQTETGYRKDNILVGGVNGASNILLQENMSWTKDPNERNVNLGRYADPALNKDIRLVDNYLVGETLFTNPFETVTMTGNMFYVLNPQNLNLANFPDNTYVSQRPTGTRAFIQPNQYDSGRAHVVVYNWDLLDWVQVDLSQVLEVGDLYLVRNAQNYFGPPVAGGVYAGSPVVLPMAGLIPAQPVAPGVIEPSEYTGKEFNAFVLVKTNVYNPRLYIPLLKR